MNNRTLICSKSTQGNLLLVVLFIGMSFTGQGLHAGEEPGNWFATWAASAMPASDVSRGKIADRQNFTIRQIVKSSIGGEQLRLRFSNVFGEADITVEAVTVGIQEEGINLVPGSLRQVTFSGSTSVRIPSGSFVYSDPVGLDAPDFSNIAVSLYLQSLVDVVTSHSRSAQVTYISQEGNYTSDGTFPVADEIQNTFFLTGIEVNSTGDHWLIACFGDSITVGAGSPLNSNWPTYLAQRLAGKAGLINEGISGNRLLHDFAGVKGVDRFERDVLSWSNLTHVIVMLGINDLGYPRFGAEVFPEQVNSDAVSVDEMIAGYRELIRLARTRGVKIFGATLTPYAGSGYYMDSGEEKRQAINRWIRESGEFDGVIDFDLMVRDETFPERFAENFHPDGDWLHPGMEGHKAMADGVDLSLFE